ncbi:MAG: YqgE/AlgH family protein [Pigmentiphaga sp.]|uniref:YqgE/AlgH family protein n=1 Tax=Pigmentiphaga sp. TaxID=1977564 RepID=UPI0029ACC225|nr:YqgE/AlgH family protein [Pigmentiphaga sp.]MDX3906811.1 YqgE/AlgH family protein [Pigmentiphaga sp.]
MSERANIDLTNQFLIAMPGMADPNFAGAVIYVCEHTPKGALGLVINRPTDLTLASLFERIELSLSDPDRAESPVFFGGPVQTDRGFVLHAPVGEYNSSIKVGDLALTTSRDVLQAVSEGQGPGQLLVTLGYAGWEAGQLEDEISENAWLSVSATPEIIFNVPPAERFDAALALLGIAPIMLAGEAGHA